jgi:diguanylate cyclase (GGDEF)-like protein
MDVRHHRLHLDILRGIAVGMAAIIMIAGIFICFMPIVSLAGEQADGEQTEGETVRVGWFDSTYCYKDQFGRRLGMSYEYQQKLVAYTGWNYEYVDGTFPELLQMLIDGEIDLLSDVSYTEERAENILYSGIPMGSETYFIFIKAGNTDMSLDDISSFEGKIFAVDKDTVMEDMTNEWAEKNGINIELRQMVGESVDECFELLEKGEVDAYVTVESYGERESCVPVCPVGSSDYYFAVNKNRPDLLKELNSALISVQNEDPYYGQRLFQKYLWSANTNVYPTEDEKKWLSEHGNIRVGYLDNYMPFCWQEEGELRGALSDFLADSSDLLKDTHIEFETKAYPTTEKAIEALQNGEVDTVFPINISPYDMENLGLLGTEDLIQTEIFAVIQPEKAENFFNNDGIRAVLVEGNVIFDVFIQDYFPVWTVDHKPVLEECYKAVSQGEADCTMVNSYRITQTDRLRKRYKLSLLATGQNMGFSLAVRKQDKELYSVMNKIINLTDRAVTETNLSKHAGVSEKITLSDYIQDNVYRFVSVVAAILMFIMFLMLAKFRSDKKASDRQKLISATELDQLTKLYTRNYFFEYAAIMHKENPDYPLDAVIVDVEQFHVINAIYGWEFGDRVLTTLAGEIQAYISENDGIACRSHADRFDLYCLHTDDYMALYERLQGALDVFADTANLHIRMGVMPYQPDLAPVELFDRARTACSMIRGSNQSRLMVFNEDMREREILEQRFLNDLKYAVDHHEFLVYYQPKYNVQVDPPVLQSAEALVRWKHHDLGMIPPGQFISLFEKHGQINVLDQYVWRETAAQISRWQKKYGIAIPVSVNLSRIDIFDPNLIKTIDEIVEQNELTRSSLHLEVTESAYTEDAEHIIGVVKSLRDIGYFIEMDDFGTGYSSLNMLSSMPVDILKLDKSFIDNIAKTGGTEEKDIRLAELILDIAKSLKLMVVAEGVEDKTQLDFLKERGCEMVQGYFFSPPIPGEEFEKLAFENKKS